jgi:hypothetical protein
MDIAYAFEKLSDTVSILSKKSGTTKSRLKEATTDSFVRISKSDMPKALLDEYKSIYDRLTKTDPVDREGRFYASIEAMSDTEATELTEDIKKLEKKIQKMWK